MSLPNGANPDASVTANTDAFDVVVIGGGPAGSTAGLLLAREGLQVLITEREHFPRFHIGESLLPRNMTLFRQLGIEEKLRSIPHTDKYGVEVALGHEDGSSFFSFSDCLGDGEVRALNVERAAFDALLLAEAERAGASVWRGRPVDRILHLEDGNVRLEIGAQTIRARYVIDASGQSTVVGNHLRTRTILPDLKKVAYFGHFSGVRRHRGFREGYPAIVMMRDGWFWIIPLDQTRTSVGLVLRLSLAKQVGARPAEMLDLAISRCPMMARRMENATPLNECTAIADYSYRCRPYAGEGYFLAGDAATFVDPVFSTGVCIGMMGAARAAEGVIDILQNVVAPKRARRSYIRYVESSTSVLFDMVRSYYRHSFREILLQEVGPLGIHRAVVSILAGNVFPRPRFALSWRLWLFRLIHRVQAYLPVAPRRESHALVPEPPGEIPTGETP